MAVNRSVLRGIAVLEAMAEIGEPVPLGTLVEHVGLDKATVWRLLSTLVEAGYVIQDEDTGRYALTNRVLRLARSFFEHSDLRSVARPHLMRLRNEADETVHLGQIDGERVVYIDKIDAERSVRLVSSVAQGMPIHTTSLGKAILAHLPEAADLIEGMELTRKTPQSITNPNVLLRELRIIREVGYATDHEENEENVICVGSPVLDGRGRVIAAVSVSGPKFRVGRQVKVLGELCRRTAERISSDLEGASAMIAIPPLRVAGSDASQPGRVDDAGDAHEESTP